MNEMNSKLRLQSKMIFIQFLISIPQYPALQPQADTVKENKRIDTQHVTTPDKIRVTTPVSIKIQEGQQKSWNNPWFRAFFPKFFFILTSLNSANWKLQGMAIKTTYTADWPRTRQVSPLLLLILRRKVIIIEECVEGATLCLPQCSCWCMCLPVLAAGGQV